VRVLRHGHLIFLLFFFLAFATVILRIFADWLTLHRGVLRSLGRNILSRLTVEEVLELLDDIPALIVHEIFLPDL
jgi:hypothetical protein